MKTGSKPTEALSRLALYAVIGLAVVVYALFTFPRATLHCPLA